MAESSDSRFAPVREDGPGHMSGILGRGDYEKGVDDPTDRGSYSSEKGTLIDLSTPESEDRDSEVIFNPGASLGRAVGQLLGPAGPVVMAWDGVEEASAVTYAL